MLLSELRKELDFNTDLLSLIDTLKNIAGAKYHEMEKKKERFDEFMDAFSGFFRVVNLVDVSNPLVREESDVLGIVLITSDSGFMGGLNQGVMRKALEIAETKPPEKVSFVVIGEKGAMSFGDARRKFKAFPGVLEDTIYEQAVEIKDYLVEEVLEKRMGKVIFVYPRPLSFTAQEIATVDLLPCSDLFDKDSDAGIASRIEDKGLIAESSKVIVESSYSDMLSYLVGVWISSMLALLFEDSKLSEFSARAMHLEGSFQKIEETHEKLRHKVFKASHELIDKGMRECHAAKQIKEKKKKKKKKLKEAEEKAAAQKKAASEQQAA
ncbi:hypothetical protein BVX97_00740 [bacterium E08(2017)]|nr:hypothetical protein BVX97_00740 [bacterium E08(2017)]